MGGHGGVTHSTGLASSYGTRTLVAWRYLDTGVVAGVTEQSQGEAFPHNTVQEVWLLCSAMGVYSHQGGFGVCTLICRGRDWCVSAQACQAVSIPLDVFFPLVFKIREGRTPVLPVPHSGPGTDPLSVLSASLSGGRKAVVPELNVYLHLFQRHSPARPPRDTP